MSMVNDSSRLKPMFIMSVMHLSSAAVNKITIALAASHGLRHDNNGTQVLEPKWLRIKTIRDRRVIS